VGGPLSRTGRRYAIKDLGFVRNEGKTLVPQPHLHFDAKDMWTLDDVRGHALGSPLRGFRALKAGAERDAAIAEYRRASRSIPAIRPDSR
jgi:propane 2-monooxygenase large subunit